jgi:phospholysine phosphohistidine inorganic pyrophosphate phosphatase
VTPETPRAYLLDLDGTLYAGGAATPGAAETLRRLRRQQIPFRLVTNTTSRSRAGIVERMADYGIDVSEPEVFTATLAGAEMARAAGFSRVSPFIPEPALEDLKGIDLVGGTSRRRSASPPDAVLLGDLAERWNFDLLQEAFEYIMTGAAAIALSRDRYWLKDQRLTLDAGPFVAALEFATGREFTVAGKPSSGFYAAALASLGLGPSRAAAMVGDDLWSDVAGAQRAGLQGWLVRTGKFRESVLLESGIQPDRIIGSVAAVE